MKTVYPLFRKKAVVLYTLGRIFCLERISSGIYYDDNNIVTMDRKKGSGKF